MKRILIPTLLALFGCTERERPIEKSSLDTLHKVTTPTVKPSIDTNYTPLSFKIDRLNTLTIKRAYNAMGNQYHQTFFLNDEKVFTDTSNYLVEGSKYSRIIINNGQVLFFMECDGRPNFDYLSAYSINIEEKKVTYLSSSVFENNSKSKTRSFTDIDGDGFIEYGGFDIIEAHPHPDSMYYNPSSFYEIRNGKVKFDSALVKKQDIKLNGIYLKNPINITIRKPKN